MALTQRHRASLSSLAWLLALALLLPLAQTVAAWHGLTHLDRAAQSAHSGAAHTTTALDCDLCMACAAVGSGALPCAPLLVAPSFGEHRASFAAGVVLAAAPSFHYLSRAPPVASA